MLKIDKKMTNSLKNLDEINQIISDKFFGQRYIIDQVLSCVIASGNTLLVGVPGLGKTLLFQTLSDSLNLISNRIQCTPDLMPSDILGTEIMNPDDIKKFSFIKGPVFSQLLMVDEINRASPRTQSALLQAMQEGFITINGKNFLLPKPFIVLATENPIEQEGTYTLPVLIALSKDKGKYQELLTEIKENKIDINNVLNEFTTKEIIDDSKEIINGYLNESIKAIFALKNHALFPVLENINNYLINRTN